MRAVYAGLGGLSIAPEIEIFMAMSISGELDRRPHKPLERPTP